MVFGDDRLVVAENYFDKTRRNLKRGSKGAIRFRTKDGKACRVKGALEYDTPGPVSDHMKTWRPKEHPGHGGPSCTDSTADGHWSAWSSSAWR